MFTSIAMIAFAGNSLLCRIALKETTIDAMSFTSIRLISGAFILWLIITLKHKTPKGEGNWPSAAALFIYAASLSFAYISLPTATGALILFSAVQATMITSALRAGEHLNIRQISGLFAAFAGLIILLFPGISAPPIGGTLLMILSGIAWGVYSLRGKQSGDPTKITAGNFIRTVPITLLFSLFMLQSVELELYGVVLAIISGAIASGLGYALWYSVLPSLQSTSAATIQLSVPVIAAVGGIIFLGEAISMRLCIASIAILGGIALVITTKKKLTANDL